MCFAMVCNFPGGSYLEAHLNSSSSHPSGESIPQPSHPVQSVQKGIGVWHEGLRVCPLDGAVNGLTSSCTKAAVLLGT